MPPGSVDRHGLHADLPLYGIQTFLRACAENLTDKQKARLITAIDANEAHDEEVVTMFRTCPIPEISRRGRNLRRWRDAFLAHFTTGLANNAGSIKLRCHYHALGT